MTGSDSLWKTAAGHCDGPAPGFKMPWKANGFGPLKLAGDAKPFEVLGGGVKGQDFRVLDEDGADDAGIVGAAKVEDCIGNDADLLVSVEQGKNGLGESHVGEVFISALGGVLDRIGEELELIHEMGEKRLVNLGEFEF